MQKHYLFKTLLKISQHANSDQTATSQKNIEQIQTADLFLNIITLIQKHYSKCTYNLDRVKELEDDE